MASGGSGRLISTLVAADRSLNCDRAFTRYSVRLRLCLSTTHSTQISGFTFWLSRYVLQSRVGGRQGHPMIFPASCWTPTPLGGPDASFACHMCLTSSITAFRQQVCKRHTLWCPLQRTALLCNRTWESASSRFL